MLRLMLLTICLSACESLPPFPAIWQCVYRNDKAAFYCVNTQTKAQLKIPQGAPSMKGAQCVSPKDFNTVQSWITSVKEIAEEHCH